VGPTSLPAGLSLSGPTVVTGGPPSNVTWTVSGNVNVAPGSYAITAVVTDDHSLTATTTFTIKVTQEDARATYTGPMLAFTGVSTNTATVNLEATVQDITAVLPGSDAAPGDIQNASVKFVDRGNADAVLCTGVFIGYVSGDTKTGIWRCPYTFTTGSQDSASFTIGIVVNNYYSRNDAADNAIIEVSKPNGTFITGGGYLVAGASAGSYIATPGSKINFGFNVKYNKNKTNLQGHANIIFRVGTRTYQIKTTATDDLGIGFLPTGCSGGPSATCAGVANFSSKANLNEVTSGTSTSVLGGLKLVVTITDKGEPGSADKIGLTLWNGTTLVFSTSWTGAKTDEKTLNGGNLVVH
jgi:hypothetical protein